jgi:hypothetical protein
MECRNCPTGQLLAGTTTKTLERGPVPRNKSATTGATPLQDLADKVAVENDADVLLFNAPLERHFDQRIPGRWAVAVQ